MNTVHPMELFLLSIALFLYAFANFRLTRVLCCSAKATQFMEALAHVGCMTLAELLLCFLLSQEQSILVVFVFVLVCGFFILFLYDRSPQRNLRTLLKLFGCDWLLIAIWILADGGYENTDDVFLFLTLCGARSMWN